MKCVCRDGTHESFGACLRDKNVTVGYAQSWKGLDRTAEKRWDRELDLYRDARRQGVQPKSTRTADVRRALDISDRFGGAYRAA